MEQQFCSMRLLLSFLFFCCSINYVHSCSSSSSSSSVAFQSFETTRRPLTLTRISKPVLLHQRQRLHNKKQNAKIILAATNNGDDTEDDAEKAKQLEYIKQELKDYLEKRKELKADEQAEQMVGKVIGGTKGNAVLEFVSGSPNKAFTIEEKPNVFDYDELERYGYGYLVVPIMNAGGRNVAYQIMDMELPPLPERLKPKSAPKLVIDKTGETDKARYSGLKMGQVLDDDAMAQALENARKKQKEGQPLRPKLMEEEYVQPFADKRNVGPQQTPDWTAEKLDEAGKQRGRAEAWARRAKEGEFLSDPLESLELPLPIKLYSILSFGLVAFSYGRATPTFLSQFTDAASDSSSYQNLLSVLQIPSSILLLASMGSAIVCGAVMAPSKNRNAFIWGMKGLMGGPVAISQLRGLDPLITRKEQDDADRKRKITEEILSRR